MGKPVRPGLRSPPCCLSRARDRDEHGTPADPRHYAAGRSHPGFFLSCNRSDCIQFEHWFGDSFGCRRFVSDWAGAWIALRNGLLPGAADRLVWYGLYGYTMCRLWYGGICEGGTGRKAVLNSRRRLRSRPARPSWAAVMGSLVEGAIGRQTWRVHKVPL